MANTKAKKTAKTLKSTELAGVAGGAPHATTHVSTIHAEGTFTSGRKDAKTSLLRNALTAIGLKHFGNGDTVINRTDTFYGPKQGAGTPTKK